MNNILDWEYYNSHFPKFDENQFNQYSYKAEAMVLKYVNVDSINEQNESTLKDCICDVLNNVIFQDSIDGVSSISNGGYSKSFVNTTHSDKRNALEDIIAFWLGDTDLMKERWIAL